MEKGTFVGTSSLTATEICVICVCVCTYMYKTCRHYLACHIEIHVHNYKQFLYKYGLHLDSRIETEISMQLIAVIYLPATRISLFL